MSSTAGWLARDDFATPRPTELGANPLPAWHLMQRHRALRWAGFGLGPDGPPAKLAVDETVILLTLSLHHY